MTDPTPTGVCPNCDLAGEVGHPCPERACAKRGYHAIPREYATWTESRRPHPLVGRLVGRYLAVKVLGAGGFGTVCLALQHGMLSKKAAVKVLHPQEDPATLEVLLRKFKAEAEALAVVSHPNVVQLLDYGTQDGEPFMVMEYVEGARTLSDELEERLHHGRAFDADEIRSLLEQTANGLDAAHTKGITHRDVKPENLMLQTVAGNPLLVRIVDFGLARFSEQGTHTSKAMGTPVYMAPEQLHLHEVGPWTDLYAAGVVAYELLTGRMPFPGRSVQEIIAKKLDPAYDPLTELADLHLPTAVEGFLRRALARDARSRYRNAGQFKVGLHDAHRSLRGTATLLPRDLAGLHRVRHAPGGAIDPDHAAPPTRRLEEPAPPAPAAVRGREPRDRAPAGEARRRLDADLVDLRPAPAAPRPAPHAPTFAPPPRAAGSTRWSPEASSGPSRLTWAVYAVCAVSLVASGLLAGLWLTSRQAAPPAVAAPVQAVAPAEPPGPAAEPPLPAAAAPAAPAKAAAAACEPDCEGRACGTDGCGGTCGTCPAGQPCRDGQCCTCTSGPCCDGCVPATSSPECWKYLQEMKRPLTSY